jgi:ribosomal subunit interface protein
MEIIITGSAFDTGNALKNHIKEKLTLIAKKVKKGVIHKIHIVINKEGINFVCRIDVTEEIDKKAVISSSNQAGDPYVCVDFAIKKLEEQLVKHNKKNITIRNHEGAVLKQDIARIPSETVEEVYEILGDDEDEEEETLEFEGEKKEIHEFKN